MPSPFERRPLRMKIPPLNPSPFEKENALSSANKEPPTSREKPSREQHQQQPQPQHSSTTKPSRHYTSSPLRRSILRPGETLESLFRVDGQSPRYRALCQDLIESSYADDDAAQWLTLLQQASHQAIQDPTRGPDLIRLHRRATGRFADASTTATSTAVAALWMSYAHALALYGAPKDAKLLIRHLLTQPHCQVQAELYILWASLEPDTSAQQQALQMGLDKNAQPTRVLQRAMEKLVISTSSSSNSSGSTFSATTTAATATDEGTIATPAAGAKSTSQRAVAKRTPVFSSQKRKGLVLQDHQESSALLSSSSPKRLCVEHSKVSAREYKVSTPASLTTERQQTTTMTRAATPVAVTAASNMERHSRRNSKESIRFQMAPLSRKTALEVTAAASLTRAGTTTMATPPAQKTTAPSTLALKRTPLLDTSSSSNKPSLLIKSTRLVARSRPPLLSKVLASKTPSRGALGKPERVDPFQQSVMEDDDDDSSDDEQDNRNQQEQTSSPAATRKPEKKPKLTKKLDLSYMWAWDPEKKLQKDKKTTGMPRIDESASLAPSEPSTKSSISNHTKSSHGSNNDDSSVAQHDETPASKQPSSSSSSAESNSAGAHSDFLPLVCTENMIRVNGSFYAKLGVIGKGGSCKVYRGLSKDCQVLAIKKVKLAGMDKRSIAGYSNEIALLNRLRGNPAIIQLYDSQVDLDRKAIFLVMEPGEVDLNNVLQQQQESQHLNRHFIRLTWQQMLSAVHSIHEERIIHGDLKPANFLFVRGALKLIDFGIAKAIQSDDTTNIYRENQIGTLNYMSPEAILEDGSSQKGKMKIGRASDIWSLGCILYQMVYGRTPFAELHMIPKLQAIINPNHKIRYGPAQDDAAIDAMKQCLQRKPDDRPPIVGKGGLLNEHWFLHGKY